MSDHMPRHDIGQIELVDLSFGYPGHHPLFENVNLRLPYDRAVWIRSASGRGKSAVLKILAGLLRPTGGKYLFGTAAVSEMSFEEFLPYRLNIGYSFDLGGLLANRTLLDNLLLPLVYHNPWAHDEAMTRVQELIQRFQLSNSKDLRPSAAPGSHRKATCVARALIHRPQLALLDDPAAGLSQDSLKTLIALLREQMAEGTLKQIIFTSEDNAFAQTWGAQQVWIEENVIKLKDQVAA